MSVPLEPDAAALRAMTDAVSRFVVEHVASLPQQPSFDLDGAEFVKKGLVGALPEHGRPLAEILDRLAPAVAKSFNTAGPGYLAFIPGGGLYAAALADFIACAVNRYVGVRVAAPALVQIEETAVRWMAAIGRTRAAEFDIATVAAKYEDVMSDVVARHG